jgi:hypothetical protein
MALTVLTQDGYGQIELNQVAFRRDGRIEAQCALDPTDFANVPAQNGMLLAVDALNRVVKFATDASLPIALNYTSEHIYDERALGLKNYKLGIEDKFFPRLGYLSVGDKFTTNCICSEEFATVDAVKEAEGELYGGISETGLIKVSATKPTVGPVLRVIKKTTMPDGQFALKFQCVQA